MPVTITLEAKEINLLCDILLSLEVSTILENLEESKKETLAILHRMTKTDDILRIIKEVEEDVVFAEDVEEFVNGIVSINSNRKYGINLDFNRKNP